MSSQTKGLVIAPAMSTDAAYTTLLSPSSGASAEEAVVDSSSDSLSLSAMMRVWSSSLGDFRTWVVPAFLSAPPSSDTDSSS